MVKSKEDIIKIIMKDSWMMKILQTVKFLDLPDWWICAGFVRSKIWDTLHEYSERTPLPDVDVVYFDSTIIDERVEKELEAKLRKLLPDVPWSVKNQARMHVVSQFEPYTSTVDAISKFPETVTSLGVKLDENNTLQLAAPWGIDDVIELNVRPTPHYKEPNERLSIYHERINRKNWSSVWYKVTTHVN